MFDLHPVILADKAWVDPIVLAEASPSADYNFGNIFLWDETFHQQIGRSGGRMVTLLTYGPAPFFVWPIGSGDVRPVLNEMREYAAREGFPFVLRGVTADHLPLVENIFGPAAQVTEERDLWDYLYSAEKLDTLSGKHLHAKRNHIHRFEEENDWRFAPLTAADFPACRALLDKWLASCGEAETDGVEDEHRAIKRAFQYWDGLGLEGGALWVGHTLAAFSLGEMTSPDTFDVHFEKADAAVDGAYPMINREFVRHIRALHPGVQWINREDDTGRESLRRSKQSYHPDRMVEKYKVELKNG